MGKEKISLTTVVNCHTDCPSYKTLSFGVMAFPCPLCGAMRAVCAPCLSDGRHALYDCEKVKAH